MHRKKDVLLLHLLVNAQMTYSKRKRSLLLRYALNYAHGRTELSRIRYSVTCRDVITSNICLLNTRQ